MKIPICISGDYRSGKSGFVNELSKELQLTHYSMRKLKECESLFNTTLVDWSNLITDKDNSIIDNYILDKAKQENCLLDFRYSALLCHMANIPYIGIWITSSFDARVYGNTHCWKMSPKKVIKTITEREKSEVETCLRMYNLDFRDKKYYHIIVDLTKYWYENDRAILEGMKFQDEITLVKQNLSNAFCNL